MEEFSEIRSIAFLATKLILVAATGFSCCFTGDKAVLPRQNSDEPGAHAEASRDEWSRDGE
jgi:hypothetical protein